MPFGLSKPVGKLEEFPGGMPYGLANYETKVNVVAGDSIEMEMCLDPIMSEVVENLDVFACNHSDMIGVDLELICHHLNIDPEKKGVRHKRRENGGHV